MPLLMLCRIWSIFTLYFQAKMVSTRYACSIADWNKEKEYFVFRFPSKLKELILKLEVFRVIFYTTGTCKLMLSFVQTSFLVSKIILHAQPIITFCVVNSVWPISTFTPSHLLYNNSNNNKILIKRNYVISARLTNIRNKIGELYK